MLRLGPTDDRERVGLVRPILLKLRYPHQADATRLGADGQQREKVTDFLALEEIAQVKEGDAQFFQGTGNARKREMASRQDDLLAVRDSLRFGVFDMLADGGRFRGNRRRHDLPD